MVEHEISLAYFEAEMVYGLSNPIASGMTTCIYEHENEDKVYGVTVDFVKLNFMKKAKLPGFKIIVESEDSVKYEMDKLNTPSKEDASFLNTKIEKLKLKNNSLTDSTIEFIKELFGDMIHIESLKKTVNKVGFKNIYMDISLDQFLSTKSGKIVCVDPIMDMHVYREIA